MAQGQVEKSARWGVGGYLSLATHAITPLAARPQPHLAVCPNSAPSHWLYRRCEPPSSSLYALRRRGGGKRFYDMIYKNFCRLLTPLPDPLKTPPLFSQSLPPQRPLYKMSRIPVFKIRPFLRRLYMGRLERHPPSSSRFSLFFPKSQFPKLVAI